MINNESMIPPGISIIEDRKDQGFTYGGWIYFEFK